jgi:hypothetical protein
MGDAILCPVGEIRTSGIWSSLSRLLSYLRPRKSLHRIIIVGVHGWIPTKLLRAGIILNI